MTDSIPARLLDQARRSPHRPAYHVRDGEGWTSTSWAEYASQVRQAARALLAHGLQPGERIGILGFNRPEWTILDIATMMVGGVPAGIYTTCSPDEVAYILSHSEASLVLLEDSSQWDKVAAKRGELPQLQRVVLMRGTEVDDELAITWDEFLATGEGIEESAVDARLDALEADNLATFIYTSGTTGPPKAVMLTHGNLTFTANTAIDMVRVGPSDRMVSYLPLSHIAEQVFTIHGALTGGYEIFYARSMEVLLEDIKAAQPTVLFAVPRVWEKMHAKLAQGLGEATGVKAIIAGWATGIGRRVSDARNRSEQPSGLLALQYRLANRLIFSKIKERLGLSAARFGISGAAPIAPEILEFFAGLDIVIHEVYGQSEDTGPTTFNAPGATRYGTVGTPLAGTEVRIATDGEILVRGPHVFAGYFKDEGATAEALQDGWLHSGDLGAFDDRGFLTITGRKKEIIITAGGKNIAPKNIEGALKNLPLVSQAVVIGDRRKFLSALITLNPDVAAAFAAEHGLTGPLHEAPELIAEIDKGVQGEVNPQFARVEHVRKFTVLSRDFSVEEGELTPTLKIKRRIIDAHFTDAIEAMYAG